VSVEVLPSFEEEKDRRILAWKSHEAIREKFLASSEK
jgi:hypothetical protein